MESIIIIIIFITVCRSLLLLRHSKCDLYKNDRFYNNFFKCNNVFPHVVRTSIFCNNSENVCCIVSTPSTFSLTVTALRGRGLDRCGRGFAWCGRGLEGSGCCWKVRNQPPGGDTPLLLLQTDEYILELVGKCYSAHWSSLSHCVCVSSPSIDPQWSREFDLHWGKSISLIFFFF